MSKGFTIIELLVVVAIICVIAGFVISSVENGGDCEVKKDTESSSQSIIK